MRYLIALVALLAILCGAMWWISGTISPQIWWNRLTGPTVVETMTPIPATQPKPVVTTQTASEGANCFKKQAATLVATRIARLAKVKAEVQTRALHHAITTAQAAAIDAYLDAHPDGDVSVSANGFVRVTWVIQLDDGRTLHLSYAQKCVCHEWAEFILPKPPASQIVKRIVPRVIIPLPGPCASISFTAPVGSHVRWGIGSIDGLMPPSSCNAQRQGAGPFYAWYGECDYCVEATDFIDQLLHGTAIIVQKYFYPVKAPEQELRSAPAVRTKVVYVCVVYPDGSIHTVFVRPEDWHGGYHVAIADRMWAASDGTEQ